MMYLFLVVGICEIGLRKLFNWMGFQMYTHDPVVRLGMAVDKINALLKAQQQQMVLLERRQKEAEAKRAIGAYRDFMAKVIVESFAGTSKYTNLVMAVGYAGFFAIWNGVRGELYVWATVLSALFMGVSLATFVFFEVGKMQRMFSQQESLKKAFLDLENGFVKARLEVVDEVKQDLETAKAEFEIAELKYSSICFTMAIAAAALGCIVFFAGMLATLFSTILPA